MWARLHILEHLSVSKEWEDALLNNFLEDKVLIVVAEL
jgi:hypothetical protein